ncbi:hypothetical protein [Acidovorax sp. K2F]|uniref:hypothetical protein n=1 Tax=Acidovorax sp. K2F TaxID=2978125 RepID=UPI0021B151E7|nr:hypothetical protein [Acidovorax sp. K2F]MCT6721688.1 hypothetical protein [Acidovorax sp. K2F]
MTNDATQTAAGTTLAGTSPNKGTPNRRPTPQMRRVEPDFSPSLIVLSLRPEGSKFNGDRIERAQESGFDWLKKIHLIGMSDPDTGGEIARHVVHGGHEAFGALKEIQIHINPETCAWAWGAGDLLMDRLKRYAVLIGAQVCDGLGQPLSMEDMTAIGDHINAVMARRQDEERMARTVTLPNGEKRELSELSFAYVVTREAGSKKRTYRTVQFDVPSLPYYQGRELGMRMAGEVVKFYVKHQTAPLDILGIMREAMSLDGLDYDKATKANVASGFLEVLSTLIRVGATNLNPNWLDQKIKRQGVLHEEWLIDNEERKTEFVARMKAAREAKQMNGGKA